MDARITPWMRSSFLRSLESATNLAVFVPGMDRKFYEGKSEWIEARLAGPDDRSNADETIARLTVVLLIMRLTGNTDNLHREATVAGALQEFMARSFIVESADQQIRLGCAQPIGPIAYRPLGTIDPVNHLTEGVVHGQFELRI